MFTVKRINLVSFDAQIWDGLSIVMFQVPVGAGLIWDAGLELGACPNWVVLDEVVAQVVCLE